MIFKIVFYALSAFIAISAYKHVTSSFDYVGGGLLALLAFVCALVPNVTKED